MPPSSKLHAWRWSGAAYEPCDSVPLEDRGFRYGMALFESLRVHQGRPLFFRPHLDRLREACRQREFPINQAALDAAEPILASLGEDAFARLYVTGGPGGPGDPPKDCGIYILLEARSVQATRPYRLAISHDLYGPIFGGLKTANYWVNIDALQRARRQECDEALLFNEHAELVSSCMANVFLVAGGTLRTPALVCGARNGVLREWILKTHGGRECSLFLDDLNAADEIFLANSWIGIVSISQIGDRGLSSTPVADSLRQQYEVALPTL